MSPEILVAILDFATKFGIDAGIAIANGIKGPDATIDDAIAALEAAKTKTAQDYLKAASADLSVLPPTATPPATPPAATPTA